MNASKWNERYAEQGYAYGVEPNVFFKEQLELLNPGKLLMPADGEGRNGVYAATLGWEVTSVDLSSSGKNKALKLAEQSGVSITYHIGDLKDLSFEKESFDAIGLIYAHFPAAIKSELHSTLSTYLRPGGMIILEAFSKNHLALREKNPAVGGPRTIDDLFSVDELRKDFQGFEILKLTEELVELNEGKYHIGKSSVVRLLARKR
jgi:SAM-dependent methyltransferase